MNGHTHQCFLHRLQEEGPGVVRYSREFLPELQVVADCVHLGDSLRRLAFLEEPADDAYRGVARGCV